MKELRLLRMETALSEGGGEWAAGGTRSGTLPGRREQPAPAEHIYRYFTPPPPSPAGPAAAGLTRRGAPPPFFVQIGHAASFTPY